MALAAADLAIVTDIYPAREQPIPGITGEMVVTAANAVRRAGGLRAGPGNRGARVAAMLHPGDVLLILGAGDITKAGHEISSLVWSVVKRISWYPAASSPSSCS